MKKILNILFFSAMLIVALTSCDKDTPYSGNDGQGQLSLKKLAAKVVNGEDVIENKSRAIGDDLSNFTVKVIDKTTSTVTNTWKYGSMPEVVTLPVGSYSVQVMNEEVQGAAWESPYFYGEQDFAVKKDAITEVGTVVCRLSNLKVSIKYSDELKSAIGAGEDVKVNVKVGENNELDFAYGETRAGYFKCDNTNKSLVATFSGTVEGVKITEYKVFSDVAPGQHRIITFSLKTSPSISDEYGTIGTTGLKLTATVKTVNLAYDIPTEEEPIEPDDFMTLSSSALTFGSAQSSKALSVSSSASWTATSDQTWCTLSAASGEAGKSDIQVNVAENESSESRTAKVTFTMGSITKVLAVTQAAHSAVTGPTITSETINLAGENVVTGASKVDVDVAAPAGIKNFVVDIISEQLNKDVLEEVGLTDHFDLCYPGEYEGALKGLGFPVGSDVIGKTTLKFDISGFMGVLTIYKGVHKFKLTVTDNNGQMTEETITLKVE